MFTDIATHLVFARLALVCSNAAVLLPMLLTRRADGRTSSTWILLVVSALTSVAYHALEADGPFAAAGSLVDAATAAAFLSADRVAAVALVARIVFLWLWCDRPWARLLTCAATVSFFTLLASEVTRRGNDLDSYAALHCAWHFCAFTTAALALMSLGPPKDFTCKGFKH